MELLWSVRNTTPLRGPELVVALPAETFCLSWWKRWRFKSPIDVSMHKVGKSESCKAAWQSLDERNQSGGFAARRRKSLIPSKFSMLEYEIRVTEKANQLGHWHIGQKTELQSRCFCTLTETTAVYILLHLSWIISCFLMQLYNLFLLSKRWTAKYLKLWV